MGEDFVDRIGSDRVGPYWISTVYMKALVEAVRDHVPEVRLEELEEAIGGWYETAIFNEKDEEDTRIFRWRSEETALVAHRQMVDALSDIIRAGEQISMIRKAARKAGFDT